MRGVTRCGQAVIWLGGQVAKTEVSKTSDSGSIPERVTITVQSSKNLNLMKVLGNWLEMDVLSVSSQEYKHDQLGKLQVLTSHDETKQN